MAALQASSDMQEQHISKTDASPGSVLDFASADPSILPEGTSAPSQMTNAPSQAASGAVQGMEQSQRAGPLPFNE